MTTTNVGIWAKPPAEVVEQVKTAYDQMVALDIHPGMSTAKKFAQWIWDQEGSGTRPSVRKLLG